MSDTYVGWVVAEKERLIREGRESGQRFIFHFGRDSRDDWVVNLGGFERPVKTTIEKPYADRTSES